MQEKPYLLSIAGLDPSAGAGLLADVKTMEAFNCYGLGVCSAITVQNDCEFDSVQWVDSELIVKQIEVLLRRFTVPVVKIGLIENLTTLQRILQHSTFNIQHSTFIWDPILSASAGFQFHHSFEKAELVAVLKNITLITPNIPEACTLAGIENPDEAATWLSQHCSVLLKGGHSHGTEAVDVLYLQGNKIPIISPMLAGKGKHGTGCVLSAAIAAGLATGYSLETSCREAKEYMNLFLASNDRLLGYHNYTFTQ